MFVDELNSRLNVSQPLPPLSRYAAQTYDAVWAMALSLNGAEIKWKQWKQNNSSTIQPQLDHFDYTRYDMALEFFHQFSRLNFLGVSVCIHLQTIFTDMHKKAMPIICLFSHIKWWLFMRLSEVNKHFHVFILCSIKSNWVSLTWNIDFLFSFSFFIYMP